MDDLLKIIKGNFDNLTKEFNINPNKLYKNFDDYFTSATVKIPKNFSTEYNARAVDIYHQLKNEAKISSDDYTAQRRKKINNQKRRRNNRRKEFTMEDGSTVTQYLNKDGNVRAQVKVTPDGTREVRRQHTAKTISEDPLAENMSKVVSTYDGHTTDIHRRPDAMHIEQRTINHDTGDIVTTHQTRAHEWGGKVSSENIDFSTVEEERLLHNHRMEQRYGGANNTQQNTNGNSRSTLKNGDKTWRPETRVNGNSIEIDSIYNHSTPKKVNKSNNAPQYEYNRNLEQGDTINLETGDIEKADGTIIKEDGTVIRPPEQNPLQNEIDNEVRRAEEQRRQQQQQEQTQSQPETQTRQDRTNVNKNGKPNQGPIPNTTSGPYVNNTRIDLDPETSVSTMDISDPLNIHQKIVDGNGNTRDITWRRKGRWSDQKELVSDISWNENGVFDNIAQTYTGKDVSPIEWKYAADWSDDYIIGRAGDDEQLLNSMMNARERKIEARRKYEEKHNRQQQSSNTADNTAQQQVDGPKAFDPNDPTTWTDKDIANMADGDPEVYEELLKQRNEATGGSTQNVEAANETVNPPDAGPDMSNPLNWTDEYMDEMSEGDPTYYEQLSKQRDAAIKAEKYKNIDPSNPSSWTDDYIKDTALNEDEFNWMNKKMRQAKNLDIVDEINQQRRNPEPKLNREQKRQQAKDNKQKGNQQKKQSKKQREKNKKQQKFNDRHKAMGNDPEEQKRINKEYNEARRREKEQEKQQKEIEEQERQRRQAEAEQRQRIDSGDPSQWTDEDIKKMADGDPDVYEDLINQRDKARGVDTSQRTSDYNKEMGDTDAPKVGDSDIEKLEAEGLQGTDMDASMRRGTLGTIDKVMTGVNILGAIGDYKSYRRRGDNVISAGVKTAAKFAIDEALGLWAIPIALVKNVPGAIIKGADMLYKENRKMNSAAGQQIFGDAQFLDTQQLATMRQSGMEMAKMANYNLQQTLMGNEATYLHR